MSVEDLQKLSKDELINLIAATEVRFAKSNYNAQGLVHEVEELNEELSRSQMEKLHIAKLASIGELAAGVGHEINNPLTIIIANLSSIRKEIDQDISEVNKASIQNYLQSLNECCRRIGEIVNGLRQHSRAVDDELENIDLHHRINNCVTLVRSIFLSQGVTINIDFRADHFCCLGNSGNFQQVIMNLLTNAKDALDGRENAEIKISSRNDGEVIIISVEDNGSGIPQSIQGKIFNTFYTTKEVGKGTGLGLGISHSIVEKMQGTISVNSVEKVKTTFEIKLPIIENLKIIDSKKCSENVNFDQEIPTSILIVDDEKGIRDLLVEILEGFGMTVDTASSGIIGLEKVKLKHYDFICSDVHMPEMKGHVFIKEAKKISPDSLYFIVTGGDNPLAGEVPEIYKPFSEEQLYNTFMSYFTKLKKSS